MTRCFTYDFEIGRLQRKESAQEIDYIQKKYKLLSYYEHLNLIVLKLCNLL